MKTSCMVQEGSCEMTAKTADQDAAEHQHACTSHSNHVDSAKLKDPSNPGSQIIDTFQDDRAPGNTGPL